MNNEVIVVGAGAGGGLIACLLAEAGKSVLLLERGDDLSFAEVGRNHLKNQRLSLYGNNAGPDGPGHPRVAVNAKGVATVRLPHEGGYHNNAMTVGGGTRVYGAQAWRYHPLDFRMASTYGVPEGSSLADWPLTYQELEPFYEQVEWELGVAGDARAMAHLPRYRRDYPMPPLHSTIKGGLLRQGAAALGWGTLPAPLAVNSVPYGGRPACIHCQHCVGFACPVDAKNGSQNTYLPRALATGRCRLVTGAMAERIDTVDGRATGVTYRDKTGKTMTEKAEVVVVAAGAIETARLLLLSGLGTETTGRNLQGHYYPGITGLFPDPVWDGIGPGVTTATCQFNHGNDGIIGGAMLADDFIPLPLSVWKGMTPPNLPRWGEAPKRWMRDNYTRLVQIKGPVQEIPSPNARVELDPTVRDQWGLPVARLSGTTHPETVRTAAFVWKKAGEWAEASGAIQVWGGAPSDVHLSGGQHQAGTCRMGDDPATSVTDRWCRVHGQDNLYLGDGSVHVTNGGFNPFLTIMALAARTASHLLENW